MVDKFSLLLELYALLYARTPAPEALVAGRNGPRNPFRLRFGHAQPRIEPVHGRMASARLVDHCEVSRTFAEHLSCLLKLLGFVPMHSDSQQCLNVAS
jgi:hypothetical protein